MMFLFDASIGVVPMGLVCVSEGEVSAIFDIVLVDDDVSLF